MDKYQVRYQAHQQRKAKVLAQIIEDRHSDRRFGDADINIGPILEAITKAPSSCDRKAIRMVVVLDRDDKAILSGLLVGGVGWIHRAKAIILLFADPVAYKAGDEIGWMPYLDAGVAVGQAYLSATANDYAICFVNPNIRDNNKDFFEQRFSKDIFCGAIAIGSKYDQ